YAFDRANGKMRWYSKVDNQMLVLNSVSELPVLLFATRFQTWMPNGVGRNLQQVAAVKGILKDSGKLLFDRQDTGSPDSFNKLLVDPGKGVIELTNSREKVRLTVEQEQPKK